MYWFIMKTFRWRFLYRCISDNNLRLIRFSLLFCWIHLESLSNCNANFSGFSSSVQHLQAYANEQLIKSFDYLLLSANFGTYVKNRPGFEKQFHGLSDTAWNRAIDLIKHITKRGGQHDFYTRRSATVSTPQKRILELNEINALALALDTEKTLATEAHGLHERYSHANHKARYDAEVLLLQLDNAIQLIQLLNLF